MVRETTKNNNRVQDTTAEAISRLSDYFGSIQVSNETLILGEAAGGSDMAPKKRKVASKRKRSPTPDGDADAPVRKTRTRSGRVRFAHEDDYADEEFERELQAELEEPLSPDAESNQPIHTIGCPPLPDRVIGCTPLPDRVIRCYDAPEAGTNDRGRAALFEGPRAPTLFGGNTQQQPRKPRARHPRDISDPTPEERLDWYMDAALKEVKRVLRLAKQDKLRQADLWDLVTFGQHMAAGMRQNYGIDLNTALLERERKNMGGECPEPEAGSLDLPWPKLPPRRCPTCSRVVAADEERTTWEHPWNRSSFTRLFPQEDRYDAGGVFGFSPGYSAIASDPWNIPMRQGTTYAGWRYPN